MFSLQDNGIYRLPTDLEQQLQMLDPNHPLLLAIGQYLQIAHQRRLDLQRNVQGGKFRLRQVIRWNGKAKPARMFGGMGKLEISRQHHQVQVGYSGGRGVLARWHNEGQQGSDGKRRPQRQWMGVNAVDRWMIDRLIRRHLSSR